MKHTVSVTALLVLMFFCAQLVGLFVTYRYMDSQKLAQGEVEFSQLPFGIERPPLEQSSSFVYLFVAVIIATVLILLLVRFNKPIIWRIWYFCAVVVTLSVSLAGFITPKLAFAVALLLAVVKVWKRTPLVHNLTEVLIYGGLAAIFVPIMNLFAVSMFLILISAYDAYAVWKSRHMVTLAQFQTKSKVFAGLYIPYKGSKETPAPKKASKATAAPKTAVLGGGDIGFPLLYAGVVLKGLLLSSSVASAFLTVLIIPVCATIALLLLLIKAEKGKFYPAMPFISAGCFVGYAIIYAL